MLDQLMAFTFVLGHIPGKANSAADYLSRMYLNPALKLQLRVSEKIVPVVTVEVTLDPKVSDNLVSLEKSELTNINITSVK